MSRISKNTKWYVYIIKSKENYVYVGMTTNLEIRIISHNNKRNKWTKRGTEWRLIYSEYPLTSYEARKREKYFKNNAGKEWLKRRNLF